MMGTMAEEEKAGNTEQVKSIAYNYNNGNNSDVAVSQTLMQGNTAY